MRYLCRTEEESEQAARDIARALSKDAVVHLIGDLGSGKTFLARVIAAELGADPRDVASPTFAIVHEYPRGEGPPVIHIDAYRLSGNRREWLEIGIPELLAAPGVKLIEWPRREFEEFEDGHLDVAIRVLEDGSREIEWE